MANKVGQYFIQKGLISKEYLTVRGRQPEESHCSRNSGLFKGNIVTLLAIEFILN